MPTISEHQSDKQVVQQISDPPVARALFGGIRWAWLCLVLRPYGGWTWLEAGWGKLGAAAWTGDNAGGAITGFIQGALSKTSGAHPDVQPWYAWFLENLVLPYASFWSHLAITIPPSEST